MFLGLGCHIDALRTKSLCVIPPPVERRKGSMQCEQIPCVQS